MSMKKESKINLYINIKIQSRAKVLIYLFSLSIDKDETILGEFKTNLIDWF